MAKQIRAQGGHYALKLKANHGPLFACALRAFAAADEKAALAVHEQIESGHMTGGSGAEPASSQPPRDAPAFPGLAALGRIESERRLGEGKPAVKVHYVALSKRLSPKRTLEVMRTHWSVENNLHWPLDVVFHEDDARSRKDHAPQNLAVITRKALDILRPSRHSIPLPQDEAHSLEKRILL